MPSTQTRTDENDVYSWTTIETTFDDEGIRTGILTTYDNGVTLQDSYYPSGFDDATLPQVGSIGRVTTRTDTQDGAGGVFGWDSIATFYDYHFETNGPSVRLFERLIDDSGISKTKTFDPFSGALTRQENLDLGDVKSWDSIVYTYGEDPREASMFTVYDNGDTLSRVDTVALPNDGLSFTRTTTREDVSDSRDYQYTTETFLVLPFSQLEPTDNDVFIFTESQTLFDDGVFEVKTAADDVTETIRVDKKNSYDWSSIEERIELSGASEKYTYFDDGTYTLEYATPLLSGFIEVDATNQLITRVEKNIGANGVITDQTRTSINETQRIIVYDDEGRKTEVIEIDDAYDVTNFQRRDTLFDENGNVTTRATAFDDGVTRIEGFEDNVRVITVTTDTQDVRNYDSRVDTFDSNGVLAQRETVYDDGVTRIDNYDSGVRLLSVTTDSQDTRNYDEVIVAYDPSTDSVLRNTIYDNGLEVTDIRVGGVLQSRTQVDRSADGCLRNFVEKTTNYDADGNLEKIQTRADSGDEFVFIYGEDRALETRIDYDGNMSEDWTFKVTEYDPDNGRTVAFYDSIADAPVEIIDDFGFISTV